MPRAPRRHWSPRSRPPPPSPPRRPPRARAGTRASPGTTPRCCRAPGRGRDGAGAGSRRAPGRAAAGAAARSRAPGRERRRPAAAGAPCLPPRAARAPAPSILVVLLADRAIEVGGRRRAHEPLAEGLVLQEPRDARQRLQVRPGGVLRRHQQEEEVRRLAVERAEIDAARAAPEGGDHPPQARELTVREGGPLAERRAVQLLAVLEGLDGLLAVDRLAVSAPPRPRQRVADLSPRA